MYNEAKMENRSRVDTTKQAKPFRFLSCLVSQFQTRPFIEHMFVRLNIQRELKEI